VIWSYPERAKAIATFEVNAVTVQVSLEQRDHSWNVTFTVEGSANEVVYSALSIFERVFSAVIEFLAVREPQTVVFAAEREDLAGIYQTYLEKESKQFAALGYRVDGQHRVLRRFKPSRWAAPVKA